MKVVIAGGTGFLGAPLARHLAAEGHEVIVLSRRPASSSTSPARIVAWQPDGSAGEWRREIDNATAVVNLAGESIAERRWSDAQKNRILESRRVATRSLVSAIHAVVNPPQVFVSGSAVGYYGPLDAEVVTEEHDAGADFLARVCAQWEAEAAKAANGTRVVCIRTGLVLEKDGGALPRMLMPFKLGAGGPLGSGRQFWPWIHRHDWIAMVRWTIDQAKVAGPINLAAPTPATNAEFTKALGRALGRPAFLPAPAFALRLMLGEMADALLLSGQRAVPAKALRLGFTFRHTDLDETLRSILS